LLVAQISDPHISTPGAELYGGYRPDDAFGRVLDRIAALRPRPDFVWLTGDLVENGTAEEYANFRERIAGFDLPLAAIPGNHDARATFVQALSGTAVRIGGPPSLNLAVDDLPVRMIGLDSKGAEGVAAGRLPPDRLDWLAARLAQAPGRPTALFLHHPPFATGIAPLDAIGCLDGPALGRIVASHPEVRLVSAGHVHRAIVTPWAGTIASVCPSVASAVPLGLGPDARARLEPQSPGFQLHLWTGAGFVTHTEFLAAGR
jgi:3',5'-cyclic AMP phosphodiesterase CpdA